MPGQDFSAGNDGAVKTVSDVLGFNLCDKIIHNLLPCFRGLLGGNAGVGDEADIVFPKRDEEEDTGAVAGGVDGLVVELGLGVAGGGLIFEL